LGRNRQAELSSAQAQVARLQSVLASLDGRLVEAREALLTACPLRLRPILMTSVATIAGAVPAAASLGAGSETLRPMGIAIVFGMALSTLLTLFVVPASYSLLSRLERQAPPAATSRQLQKLSRQAASRLK
jgi:Cu/Ag efflux pump CusA